jgi:PAS domain S-box-containing protein
LFRKSTEPALAEAQRECERLEGLLRTTEQLYQTLVETVPAITYVVAPDIGSSPVFVSRQFEDVLGHPRDAWLTNPDFRFDLIHQDDRDRVQQEVARFLQDLDGLHLEYRAIAADGTLRWLRETATVFVPEDGSERLIQGMILDVTGLRDAQSELESKRRELQLILDSVPAAISFRDVAGRLAFINRGFADLVGQPTEELLGQSVTDLFPEHGDEILARDQKALELDEALRETEEELDTAHGPRWIRSDRIPYRDADGETHGLISFSIDVSEKRELEQQLRQSQKMQAIGRVAGGVAHDFNNLLTVIQGNAELLLDHADEGTPLHQGLSQIGKAVSRAAALTSQLLAFSRKQVMQPQVLDLAELTADMHKMLERLLGDRIELAFDAAADLGRVKADPNQLQQVLMNLVVNARDAMPDGGTITVSLNNVALDYAHAGPEGSVPPGDFVELAVTDTGIGMDEQTRSRIFEPFFSTKGPGRGTGLGLATVYGIVKQSRGHVLVDTRLGEGTTFRVLLPIVDEPAAEVVGPADVSEDDVRGTERVMAVEDDPEILKFLANALTSLGYEVDTAGNGEEAIALFGRGFAPDVLVTDIEMPEMTGTELAQWFRANDPEFPVVFVSGYSSDPDDDSVESGPCTAFVAKPFQPSTLALAVRQVLTAAAERAYDTQPQL